jgi:hypothetical protein
MKAHAPPEMLRLALPEFELAFIEELALTRSSPRTWGC